MAKKSRIAFERLAAHLAVAGTFAIVWQITAAILPDFLFPGIPKVIARLAGLLPSRDFLESFSVSMGRLGAGFFIAVSGGVALGLISGVSTWIAGYLRALVSVLQSIPPITWIPLLVILIGFGDAPIIIIVSLASFYPMVQTVLSAVEQVEKIHLDVAKALGANKLQTMRKIFLPEIFPSIISGMQISFGNAWRALVAAEMLAGVSIGIGWSITFAGEIADMAGVLSHILVIGSVSVLIDQIGFELLTRRLLKWKYV